MRQRDLDRIARLEGKGIMDRRRRELRQWFEERPDSTAADAVRALGYSYPDYMYVVADSVRFEVTGGDRTLGPVGSRLGAPAGPRKA